jgi:uncharacterized surface protein with fasciclin (FAS1) repeats
LDPRISNEIPTHLSRDIQVEDIIKILKSDTNFYTFVQMLKLTGLINKLYENGPFTVLVPNNDAFGVIPHGKLDDLLHHSSSMKEVLNYHVIPGAFDSKQFLKVSTLNTLLDKEIQIKYADGLLINKARVIKSDIIASNGIIHVIDRVLKPPEILLAV